MKTTYFKSPQCHNVQNGRRAICDKFLSVQTNICPYKQQVKMKWLHLLSMKVINYKYITPYTDIIYTSHVLTINLIKWLAKIKTKILKTFTFRNLYWCFYYNNFDSDHVLCEIWFKSEVIQTKQKVDGQFFVSYQY